MKKTIIIPAAFVALIGGYTFSQSSLFSSAEDVQILTAAEAKAIALKAFDGQIIDFDYDKDDRAPHYDFDMKNDVEQVEVVVDATSGAALVTERETLQKSNAVKETFEKLEDTVGSTVANTQMAAQQAIQQVIPPTVAVQSNEPATQAAQPSTATSIRKEQAIAIAQEQATGTVVKAEFDADDHVFEVEIVNGRTEYEFDIDAATGAILSYETDTDD